MARPDQPDLLLSRYSEGRTELFAPAIIRYEVPGAIMRACTSRNRISFQQAGQATTEFFQLALPTDDSAGSILVAQTLVERYRCQFYDAVYLALARQLGIRLITADDSFVRQTGPPVDVLHISDYSPST